MTTDQNPTTDDSKITAPDNLPDLVVALLAWRDGDLVNPSPRERYSQRLAGYAAARIKELETSNGH